MKLGSKLSQLITHNWREKVIAIALAFLVWYLIKSQGVVRRPLIYDLPNLPPPGQL